MSSDNSIALKQGIIQEEIINKNYDKDKFLQFCINKKEGGDDLSNWSILELNNAIIEFIAQENGEITKEIQGDGKKDKIEKNEEKDKTIKMDVEQLNQQLKTKFIIREFPCKKLEKSPLNDKEINVELKDPKTTDRSLFESAYVSYEIVTKELNWIVRRRFSDFLWLRTVLTKCFPRIMVPPIPGKKIGSRRFEEDFIRKRMSFLQKFINAVLKCEELKASEALVAFLSFQDRNQFESKMKELSSFQPSPYIEEVKTFSGKLEVEYSEMNEKHYLNISKYFMLQGQLYDRVNYNLKQFHNSMSDAITNIQEVQKDLETLHLLNSKFQMKPEITKTIQEFGIFFRNWKRILFNQNNIIKKNVKHFFKYLKMEGDCFIELINSRQNLFNKYKSSSTSLKAKKEKLWTLGDSTKWEIINDYQSPIDSVMLVKNKEYAMSKMCTKDTQALENIHKQLGYANKMNDEQLKIFIDTNCQRYVSNIKEFAETFYPTLSDSINCWSSLNSYL